MYARFLFAEEELHQFACGAARRGRGGGGQNMNLNDMGGRPDIIWYITALVALLAGIDGEPLYEDINSLFRLSQEKQYVDYVSVSLSVLDNFSASDW